MNRWARIVVALSVAATAGWLAAGAQGFLVEDAESLALHTLCAFAALLALLLLHAWVAIFAAVSALRLRGAGPDGGGGTAELARVARWTVAAAGAAMLAATAQFVISNLLYPGRLSPHWHAVSGAATVAVLVAGLAIEARALSAHGKIVSRLAARASEPA